MVYGLWNQWEQRSYRDFHSQSQYIARRTQCDLHTFTCGDKTAKLVVTQKQQDALTVTSSKVEVDAQGGPINVEVKANIPFEYVIADKDKGWITPVETKSMQTTILTFNVAQNESLQKQGRDHYD